jgi:Xaa-Pro aminopeptidase
MLRHYTWAYKHTVLLQRHFRRCACACLLLLLPAGAEFRHYTADITRTFPASGSFTAQQRDGTRPVHNTAATAHATPVLFM